MDLPETVEGAGVADDELVRRVAAGSEAAIAILYDRHAQTVFRVALRSTGDLAVAEEVVQDTFLVLWDRAASFDPSIGPLAAWLTTIARNRALDRLRAIGRRPKAAPFSAFATEQPDSASTLEWLVSSGDPLSAGAPDPTPDVALMGREDAAIIRDALTRLPGPERVVIELAYRDGLSQSEIADRLGWPLGTVKTRSRRGLKRLREALEALDGLEGRAAGRAIASARTRTGTSDDQGGSRTTPAAACC